MTADVSKTTRLLIVQFTQLQRVAMQQLEAAAAEADGKPLSDGWSLDFQRSEWVRPEDRA